MARVCGGVLVGAGCRSQLVQPGGPTAPLSPPSPTHLNTSSPPCSEAKGRTSNAQQGDAEFVAAACRFLRACTPAQVRLAPEKCAWPSPAAAPPRAAPVSRTLTRRSTSPPRRAPPSAAVVALCRLVKQHAMALGQPKAGVAPLRAALAKLCPTPEHLSPVHADFFQL